MMLTKQNPLKKILFAIIMVILAVNIIGFCIGTFFDMEIENALTPAMKHIGVKVWTVFNDSIGYLIPAWLGFVSLSFLLEGIVHNRERFDVKNQALKNIISSSKYWIWVWYATLFIILNLIFGFAFYTPLDFSFGMGAGFDPKAMYWTDIRHYCTIVIIAISEFIFLLFVLFFRTNVFHRNTIFNIETIKASVKMVIFIAFSFITVFLLKHLFGRPFYYSNVFEKAPNGGRSMIDILENKYHISPDKIKEMGVWGQVDYKPWYIPNNVSDNFKNWFDSEGLTNSADQWWNMDFPSGHTASFAVFAAAGAYIPSEQKYKKLKIFSIVMGIFLVVQIQMSMMIYRFHWCSDVTFSAIVCIGYWFAANYIVEKNVAKWISWWNVWSNEKTNIGIFKFEDDVLIFILKHNDLEVHKEVVKSISEDKSEKIKKKLIHKYKIKE